MLIWFLLKQLFVSFPSGIAVTKELDRKKKIATLFATFDHYSLFCLVRAVKYNLRTGVSTYKVRAGAAKYKSGLGSPNTNRGWGDL